MAAAVAVAVPLVGLPGATVPVAAAGPVSAQDVAATDVRLVSGDVVTLGGDLGAQVRAAEGREHVTFYLRTDGRGGTHVVPEDAVVPLAQGRLDPALFDVTALARAGYRDTLPLIVDHRGAAPRSAAARVTRELPVLSATAVEADLGGGYWATVRDAEHVWLDQRVRMTAPDPGTRIGAPIAREAGYTGAGATVAVLDSGIDATHPDLADAVASTRILSDSTTIDDLDGYGTHIASTIAGDGEKYPGVAPDAELMIGKVTDDDGWAYTSWIIAGMEWAAANGADVVNMSLGSPRPSAGTDPVSLALNELTASTGTLFVALAGDTGAAEGVTAPGAADAALTVGAVDGDDALADFSSRGPRLGDGAVKPDITAPGVDIVGARAANGYSGRPVEDGYVALTGTSTATPHVSGAAAILAARHPDWSPEQLKAGLMGTAEPNADLTVFEQGAGRVDVAAASRASVVASVGSLDFGASAWPHDDDQPVGEAVTYTNTGTAPVTLDLTADVEGPRGATAPQGMFTVVPARLTVPAGGRASTTVTADTRVTAPDGVYAGVLVATGPDQSLRTPLRVHREVETHTVTVNAVGYDGAPSDLFAARFTNVDPEPYYPRMYGGSDPSGTVTLRLPKGEYFVDATVQEQLGDQGDYRNAEFAEPAFTVTGDTTLVFDARETVPVDLRGDEPDARTARGWIGFVRDTAQGEVALQASGQYAAFENMTVRPSTTSSDEFQFVTEAHLAKWNGTSFDGSPYFYHLRHTVRGSVPRTTRWQQHDRDLAKVRTEHARTRTGTIGVRDYVLRFPLPHTLTEYFTPDKEWSINQSFLEVLDDGSDWAVTSSRQIAPLYFSRGQTTTMRWGVGVFGPAVPTSVHNFPSDTAGRYGDDMIRVSVPMRTDQDAGRVGYALSGSTQLLRAGVVVGESAEGGGGWFPVEPERAEYTLRTEVDAAEAGLSTHISAEWTFTSEDTRETTVIPLLALRFAPTLDNDNAAPAGRRFAIPVYVQRNGNEEPPAVRAPAVEVSFDDGETWRPVTVAKRRGQWTATVDHPRGAGFVSLRSTVSDADGNRQSQTVIRAYALR